MNIIQILLKAAPRLLMARDKEKAMNEVIIENCTRENVEGFIMGWLERVAQQEEKDGCTYVLRAKRIGDDCRLDIYRQMNGAANPEYYKSYNKATLHTLIKDWIHAKDNNPA